MATKKRYKFNPPSIKYIYCKNGEYNKWINSPYENNKYCATKLRANKNVPYHVCSRKSYMSPWFNNTYIRHKPNLTNRKINRVLKLFWDICNSWKYTNNTFKYICSGKGKIRVTLNPFPLTPSPLPLPLPLTLNP